MVKMSKFLNLAPTVTQFCKTFKKKIDSVATIRWKSYATLAKRLVKPVMLGVKMWRNSLLCERLCVHIGM